MRWSAELRTDEFFSLFMIDWGETYKFGCRCSGEQYPWDRLGACGPPGGSFQAHWTERYSCLHGVRAHGSQPPLSYKTLQLPRSPHRTCPSHISSGMAQKRVYQLKTGRPLPALPNPLSPFFQQGVRAHTYMLTHEDVVACTRLCLFQWCASITYSCRY